MQTGCLDLADAAALESTLDRIAATLAELGDTNEVDIRRATALGILADPSRAQRLLEEGTDTGSITTTTVILHLSAASLADAALVGRVDGHGPLSRETWCELLGHSRITIRPVVDLNAITPVDSYEIPDRIRTAVTMRSPVDMFPYGTQPSRGLDLDHTIPYDHSRSRPPGQTRIDNLASPKADPVERSGRHLTSAVAAAVRKRWINAGPTPSRHRSRSRRRCRRAPPLRRVGSVRR